MVRFELKRKEAPKTALIIHYKCSDGELKYYPGISVSPSKFSPLKYKYIESFIDRLQSDYNISRRRLTKKILKRELDIFFNKTAHYDFDAIISKMKSGEILTGKNKIYSHETIKSAKNCLRIIKAAGNPFDEDFQNTLISYCNKKKFSLNYTGTVINRLKMFMRHSGYDSRGFKIIREETPSIALTEAEVNKLANKELTENLSIIRDWFVIGCFMGLRASDLLRLNKININVDTIIISNEKTDEVVVIPIHPIAKKVIEKYSGFPPKRAEQTINRKIQEIGKSVFTDEKFLYTQTKGGERCDTYFEKGDMLSTHTCRRTFITHLISLGINDSVIMMLAGIKSHSTLRRYNKMSKQQAAKIVADLWK